MGVAQPIADAAHRHPAVAVLVHVGDDGRDQSRRFGWLALGRRRLGHGRLGPGVDCNRRDQVLGIDEAGAGLTEAFGRLLLAETIDIDAFFADASRQSGEVGVRRHQAETVESP